MHKVSEAGTANSRHVCASNAQTTENVQHNRSVVMYYDIVALMMGSSLKPMWFLTNWFGRYLEKTINVSRRESITSYINGNTLHYYTCYINTKEVLREMLLLNNNGKINFFCLHLPFSWLKSFQGNEVKWSAFYVIEGKIMVMEFGVIRILRIICIIVVVIVIRYGGYVRWGFGRVFGGVLNWSVEAP
jgi:hypothetical protein